MEQESVTKISPEVIGRMASELIGVPGLEMYRENVLLILYPLLGELLPLRDMNVGAAEPAFIFHAEENEP
ncbi:MAG: hypothetical protein ACK4RK_18000 [Gemmataceae bacterium]